LVSSILSCNLGDEVNPSVKRTQPETANAINELFVYGKVRFYFRRSGCKSVALPGMPGSTEFMRAYELAFSRDTALPIAIGAGRVKPGTVAALTLAYFNSIAFGNLAKATQRERRNILEKFVAEHGAKRVMMLLRSHVEKMVAAKSQTPSAAVNFLIAVRALMQFGVESGILKDNPTLGVKRPKIRSDGHRTWTEKDIAAFEARHPIGSKARLGFALLLHTAQRVGDVLRMGVQHVQDGAIHIRQDKTGTPLAIPILPELQVVFDGTPPSEHLTFLTSRYGKPYTPRGFTDAFAVWREEAGLPKGLVPHGLRKAACRRLAEHGCSSKEIAAWSGHLSLREVERYTKAADQERLARSAMVRLRGL
jgi:integrase